MKEVRLRNVNYEKFDWQKLKDYEVLCEGSDDVVIINNYPQRYLFNIREDFDKIDILGFRIVDGDIKKDRVVVVEKTDETLHNVKPGENLKTISKKYNIEVSTLREINDIKEVFIGQIIKTNKLD